MTLPSTCLVGLLLLAAAPERSPAQTRQFLRATSALSYGLPRSCALDTRDDVRTTAIDIPKFSPALGRLESVDVSHDSSVFSLVDLSCQACRVYVVGGGWIWIPVIGVVTLDAKHTLSIPGASASVWRSVSSAAFSFGPPVVWPLPPLPSLPSGTSRLTGGQVAGYVGTGTVSMPPCPCGSVRE